MRRPTRVIACVLVSSCLCALPAPALGSDHGCDGSGQGVDDFLAVAVECSGPGGSTPGGGAEAVSETSEFLRYRWVSACSTIDAVGNGAAPLDCQRARTCTDTAERLWWLWGQRNDQTWTPLYSQCFGRPPTAADTPRPTVTPGLVLTALRRIGLPAVEAQTQPAGKTLVNFDTIFFAEPETFTRTLTLLGQRVQVEAQPTRFTWHHGDGTTAATTTPGAPYPSKAVTHEYTDAHRTVQARVDVTYTARFRVNGGAWQDIGETVTITGPATALRISEARPVLSGEYQ